MNVKYQTGMLQDDQNKSIAKYTIGKQLQLSRTQTQASSISIQSQKQELQLDNKEKQGSKLDNFLQKSSLLKINNPQLSSATLLSLQTKSIMNLTQNPSKLKQISKSSISNQQQSISTHSYMNPFLTAYQSAKLSHDNRNGNNNDYNSVKFASARQLDNHSNAILIDSDDNQRSFMDEFYEQPLQMSRQDNRQASAQSLKHLQNQIDEEQSGIDESINTQTLKVMFEQDSQDSSQILSCNNSTFLQQKGVYENGSFQALDQKDRIDQVKIEIIKNKKIKKNPQVESNQYKHRIISIILKKRSVRMKICPYKKASINSYYNRSKLNNKTKFLNLQTCQNIFDRSVVKINQLKNEREKQSFRQEEAKMRASQSERYLSPTVTQRTLGFDRYSEQYQSNSNLITRHQSQPRLLSPSSSALRINQDPSKILNDVNFQTYPHQFQINNLLNRNGQNIATLPQKVADLITDCERLKLKCMQEQSQWNLERQSKEYSNFKQTLMAILKLDKTQKLDHNPILRNVEALKIDNERLYLLLSQINYYLGLQNDVSDEKLLMTIKKICQSNSISSNNDKNKLNTDRSSSSSTKSNSAYNTKNLNKSNLSQLSMNRNHQSQLFMRP
ncbi:UNKNOWN [Stylonychia lemnae]|uniref:Uncharacterized protein n=1 Tax=Stylonychia lemnae TaxID=5949 RepID=A0A078ANS3_STYLE|nr:UNKNOWN [Stylonychia lemnae]|eukprot:CDW83814.1 UNKNOWN [Stylonychia lemnae]